ncbi:MAG TPA: hypothetical protein VFW33_05100, partial [Gemmataceae bacterium]|nr:hypothetical protein [Gemmataceae bacterium]
MNSSPEVSPPRPSRAAAVVGGLMECVVLVLVCGAPWAFGAVHPAFEALLYAGVAALLLLWALRTLLEGRLRWVYCPVAACLAALFLFGAAQVVPLSHGLLARLSPATASLYAELL